MVNNDELIMKTQGMEHQLEGLRRMAGKYYFGLLMEQGTGKTWTALADTERLYAKGAIDALVVVAPRGVHTNWVRREIPTHMDCAVIARAWRSGAGKRERAKMDDLMKPREHGEVVPLRVLSINIDALSTKDGFEFAQRFMRVTKCLMIVDESSRIKNPKAARTIQVMRLRMLAKGARILSGTPITNAPMDIFAQMEFLESGLLGTTSYRAFTAEYAELMSNDHPMMKNLIQQNPKLAHGQIIAKDATGAPIWKNLDKLQRLLAPHTFRVLKKDCLDLPDKIYKTHYFELTPAQEKAYKLLKEELRIQVGGDFELLEGEEIPDAELLPVSALAALVKLQQITSAYVNLPTGERVAIGADNPRLNALLDIVEDIDGKFIVWARFKPEIEAIAAALRAKGIETVEYHGKVKTADREAAVDGIQTGTARAFVGQAQSGGIGLTLTAAETTIYYSNDFNSETRQQSEDRNHRIGTKNHVVYIDLAAVNTIDESIARSLRRKKSVAALILDGAPQEIPR